MNHQLVVDSVVVRFGEKTVLSGGYITSQTGMVTGLLGRNGTGKSCMFRALMGGLKVDYVIVHIDETPSTGTRSASESSICLRTGCSREG